MPTNSTAGPAPDPQQLQWILDHNVQIRGSHRVQIADAVKAWQADRADLTALRAERDDWKAKWEHVVHCHDRDEWEDKVEKLEADLAEARARLAVPPQDQEWLESEDFDRVAYAYRSAPVADQSNVIARFEDLKSAIRGRLALPAWQPIATAPKDGTAVLTRSKNGAGFWCDPAVMYWIRGSWRTQPEPDPLRIVYHQPLIWMPLPPPPAAEQEPKKEI